MGADRVDNRGQERADWRVRRRLVLVILFLWLLVAGALLWWWSRPYTPGDIVDGSVAVGTSIDVIGYVDPASVAATSPGASRFELVDEHGAIRVRFQTLPEDLSLAGKRVRVHGVLVGEAALEGVQVKLLNDGQ